MFTREAGLSLNKFPYWDSFTRCNEIKVVPKGRRLARERSQRWYLGHSSETFNSKVMGELMMHDFAMTVADFLLIPKQSWGSQIIHYILNLTNKCTLSFLVSYTWDHLWLSPGERARRTRRRNWLLKSVIKNLLWLVSCSIPWWGLVTKPWCRNLSQLCSPVPFQQESFGIRERGCEFDLRNSGLFWGSCWLIHRNDWKKLKSNFSKNQHSILKILNLITLSSK